MTRHRIIATLKLQRHPDQDEILVCGGQAPIFRFPMFPVLPVFLDDRDVFQIREEAGVRRLPSQRFAGVDARRWLVHREDGSERAERLLRYLLDRQAQTPSDDGGDVAHRIALVGHGVPGRSGRCRLERQPEQDRGVERVHGRPALSAVARVAGHPAAARYVSQQAGKPALALVVDRAWHADRRRAHTPRSQCQQRIDRPASTADRPVGRQRVGLGGGSARHPGRTRDRDDRAVTSDELVTEGRDRGGLLDDRAGQRVRTGVVASEGQADRTVGLGDAGPQDVEIGQPTAEHLGTLAFERLR